MFVDFKVQPVVRRVTRTEPEPVIGSAKLKKRRGDKKLKSPKVRKPRKVFTAPKIYRWVETHTVEIKRPSRHEMRAARNEKRAAEKAAQIKANIIIL
jgi:hypothetical protein